MMIHLNDIQIRETRTADLATIPDVEKQAFDYDKEARLTAGLPADRSAEPTVSLLAFYRQEAVGHIALKTG